MESLRHPDLARWLRARTLVDVCTVGVMASVACSNRHGCHQRRLGLCVAGVLMKRQRSEKKNTSAAPATSKILPMELRVGDRLIDETGEWEVIGRPYTTAGGRPRTSASRGS